MPELGTKGTFRTFADLAYNINHLRCKFDSSLSLALDLAPDKLFRVVFAILWVDKHSIHVSIQRSCDVFVSPTELCPEVVRYTRSRRHDTLFKRHSASNEDNSSFSYCGQHLFVPDIKG